MFRSTQMINTFRGFVKRQSSCAWEKSYEKIITTLRSAAAAAERRCVVSEWENERESGERERKLSWIKMFVFMFPTSHIYLRSSKREGEKTFQFYRHLFSLTMCLFKYTHTHSHFSPCLHLNFFPSFLNVYYVIAVIYSSLSLSLALLPLLLEPLRLIIISLAFVVALFINHSKLIKQCWIVWIILRYLCLAQIYVKSSRLFVWGDFRGLAERLSVWRIDYFKYW
jgi:hypothetical protein